MNFNNLIELNKKHIKSIIKKITKEENEDLEQEVYIKALSAKKYEERGNFKAFIGMIARNVSFDYLKSLKTKSNIPVEDKEDIILNIQDKKLNPELKLIQNERQKRILDEINKLKPKFREIIIYTEFYGLTYEDCAKKLKCPIGTVKSRVYNAKKELAQKLCDLL